MPTNQPLFVDHGILVIPAYGDNLIPLYKTQESSALLFRQECNKKTVTQKHSLQKSSKCDAGSTEFIGLNTLVRMPWS